MTYEAGQVLEVTGGYHCPRYFATVISDDEDYLITQVNGEQRKFFKFSWEWWAYHRYRFKLATTDDLSKNEELLKVGHQQDWKPILK